METESISGLTRNLPGKPGAEILAGIADIIESNPRRWTTGNLFREKRGAATDNPELAHQACAVGFTDAVYDNQIHGDENRELARHLLSAVPTESPDRVRQYPWKQVRHLVTRYNDSLENAGQAVEWFRRAAETARNREQATGSRG